MCFWNEPFCINILHKYILMLILLYFYFYKSKTLNAGLSPLAECFYSVVLIHTVSVNADWGSEFKPEI